MKSTNFLNGLTDLQFRDKNISLAFFRWVKLDIINANIKETRVPSTLKKSNLSAPKLYSHQSVSCEKKENERF